MSRYDALRSILAIAFVVVLVAGTALTIRNIHTWDIASRAVAARHSNASGRDREAEESQSRAGAAKEDKVPEDNTAQADNGTETGNTDHGNTEDVADSSEGSETQAGENNDAQGETGNPEDINGNPDDTGEGDGTDSPGTESSADNNTGEPDNKNDGQDETDTDNRQGADADMEGFYISAITDEIFARIKGRSYPEGCTVSREELRYVHIRHYGFEGEILDGELIVNAAIAQDVLEIFEELYAIKYQIERVHLIDEYDADDETSMEHNNSSCFNYRTIAESTKLSNHAYGLAIDINPFYNPYYYQRDDGSIFLQPKGSERYLDRTIDAACIINKGDECYNIFIRHGFTWGGDWTSKKDYQHFEKVN